MDGSVPRTMRAWRERDPKWERDDEKLAALREAGIDLDPAADRGHDHADGQPHDHAHPHRHSDTGEPPFIGIVGAGAVVLMMHLLYVHAKNAGLRSDAPGTEDYR